jgi:mono/diheme cytochrome c family protein
MADQYDRPHPGPAASGASTWVKAPPPPAYVDTSAPPPRAPDAPPPAAVANRQPGQPATPPAELARPEVAAAAGVAAPPPAPAAALTPAALAAGRKLFGDNGCGGCHALSDASAMGVVGPSFDGNTGLTSDIAFQTIHDGRGPMPSFAGALTDAQIRQLANYIVGAKK